MSVDSKKVKLTIIGIAGSGSGQSGVAGLPSDGDAAQAQPSNAPLREEVIQSLILQVCLSKILAKDISSEEPYEKRLVNADQEMREMTARTVTMESL